MTSNQTLIRWTEIEAECGDYRAGFVSTFKKYEGQPTDEQDKQGRTVTVTVTSFARHMKIPEATFRDWIQGGRGDEARDRGGRDVRGAKIALRDPEQRAKVIAALDSDEIEAVIEDANDAAIQRLQAKRSEHQSEPTAGELMGGDKFDPAEYWADTLIIRVNRNARELTKLIADGGGLLFGTMPPEEAFDYLHEAERLIAEARAAAQEQVRDKTEVV